MIKFSVFLVGNDSGAISTSHSHGKQHCLPISRFTVDLKSSTTTNPSLSASEFLDRVAALMPPTHKHLHRYFGVLEPNSPWRALVVAQSGRKLGRGVRHPGQRQCAQILGHAGRTPGALTAAGDGVCATAGCSGSSV